MFSGCGTALVTPFLQDGSFDEPTFRSLVRRQIRAGIHFLVPCGTTGENPTLTRSEQRRVIEITVEEAGGKVPVLAGAGGYDTAEVIEKACEAKHLGADGILSVAPYYNKPSQEGLYRHFLAIAGAADLPMILYNVPGRTGVNLEPATVVRLSACRAIVGIKEASGNIGQIASLLSEVPQEFLVLSGDDAITIPIVSLGGKGVISVASNQIPAEMAELTLAAINGDFLRARQLQRHFLPLMEVNFVEPNPIPVKAAMAKMGLLQPVWRLPLVAPSGANQARIERVLEETGVLAGQPAHAG